MKFYPGKIHINAMVYCVSKGITIYPLFKKKEFILVIRIEKGKDVKIIESPRTYKKNELTKPIYEIYLTYFRKMVDDEYFEKAKHSHIKF